MSLVVRNKTSGPAVDVPLDDLGVTVAVGVDCNLHEHNSVTEIIDSLDLEAAINADEILLLDPSSSELSKADSLLIAAQGMLVRLVTP